MLWASLLNVWSHALGSRSRERRGRTRLQKRDNQHNLPTTFSLHICASQSRFRPMLRDLGNYRKCPLSRFQGGSAGSNPVGDTAVWPSHRRVSNSTTSAGARLVPTWCPTPSAFARAASMASATMSSRSPNKWPYWSSITADLWPSSCCTTLMSAPESPGWLRCAVVRGASAWEYLRARRPA
jgi:hypothetical protein